MSVQVPKTKSAPSGCDAFIDIDQSALDAIPTGFCVFRSGSGLVRYNQRAAELWGRSPRLDDPSEQSGVNFRRYNAEGSPIAFDATPVAQAIRSGERVVGAELVIERPDGSRVPVLMNITPLTNSSGRAEGAVCSFQELTERKRVEEALRARGAELQSVINSTPFMLVRCSRDLRYRFISEAYARMIGRHRDEVIGKTIKEALGEAGFYTLQPYVERVLRGEEVDFECDLDFAKAGRRRLSIAYRPELDSNGTVVGWIASLLDITEQRGAEQALRQLAGIVESSDDAIISKNLDGVIVTWNPGAQHLFGFSAEEAVGQSITLVIPEELRHEEPKILERIRRGERIEHYETVRRCKDGQLVNVSLTVSPMKDERGRIVGASKIARDISARTKVEAELRTLSEKLEAEVERRTLERDRVWNVSEDLLGVCNFEGYFLSLNPAWTRLLGWTEDEIRSMHVNELRHPEDAPHSIEGRMQLAQGVSTVRMENRFRHKDGSWRWLHWTMTENNGLIYVAGRHVSSEKEAAAALQRAQRQTAHLQKMEAIGQLTGGIAHDFNNLLMIVSGHAQGLKSRLKDSKDTRALQAIEMATTRGGNLTRQLLAFARTMPLNPTVINPAEAVQAIRDVLAGSMHVNIEFHIDVPETTWPVLADKSELELALVNLAVNSRDAMPDGGRISIAAENVQLKAESSPEGISGDFVALTVADTGSGIPSDLLPRVVEPFFTTKAPDKGTGLGLSQVYGFARRSDGSVTIDSQVGRGTKVTIYMPRSHADVVAPSREESGRYAAVGGQTILVVEDNADVRSATVSLLEQLGYRTVEAETAAAALEILESGQNIALIFSDVVLPGHADGLELARMVADRYPRVSVVLTTGYSKVFDADPEFPVLRKPYQMSALGRAIHQALNAAVPAKSVVVG
jgi:PAS domain S-box-containing protein